MVDLVIEGDPLVGVNLVDLLFGKQVVAQFHEPFELHGVERDGFLRPQKVELVVSSVIREQLRLIR